MSYFCIGNNGDYTYDIAPYIDDISDAIEYALGDMTTVWGSKRAKNGHPMPFNLKYVELGNEQLGKIYAERYDKIYSILKPKYPQITFIYTLGMDSTKDYHAKVDMIDPHWYSEPEFFQENTRLFDTEPRGKNDVYVGEYSCITQPNMLGALSEAAFLTGLENNADIVRLASYAPLLENVNKRDWQTNLIWFDNDRVMGRASYYVQSMFGNNTPSYVLASQFEGKDEKDFYYIAGYDRTNGETIIKVVNLSPKSRRIKISLNCSEVADTGTATVLATKSLDDENSLENPRLIKPIVSDIKTSKSFNYNFSPYSLTVIRIKTSGCDLD